MERREVVIRDRTGGSMTSNGCLPFAGGHSTATPRHSRPRAIVMPLAFAAIAALALGALGTDFLALAQSAKSRGASDPVTSNRAASRQETTDPGKGPGQATPAGEGAASTATDERASATATDEQVASSVPVEPVAATGAVWDLLCIRPFTLEQPYVYEWMRERPEMTAGQLVVLQVDPQFSRPRQTDVAVLFAGDTPAQLTNVGYPSGMLVVIVPEWVDLSTAPFYFGSTELPERIDRARGAAELSAASALGAVPFARERLASARSVGGDAAALADANALFLAVADLIDAYAPDEHERAENYRIPVLR